MPTEPVAMWPRPNRRAATEARARQGFIAFFADECPDVEVSADDGLPIGDPLAPFKVEVYDAPAWIAGWSQGALGAMLDETADLDAAAVRGARAAMSVWAGVPDPLTLGVVQAGMALCKAFAAAGAVAVLDLVALRWWAPEDLLALDPDRPFDVLEHVTLTFDTSPAHPEVGHLCHTRGMAKFARPDLALRVAGPTHAAAAGQLLTAVATAMALGMAPADGETTRVAGAVARFEARPDDAGAEAPRFYNAHLELVDAHGGGRPFPWAAPEG